MSKISSTFDRRKQLKSPERSVGVPRMSSRISQPMGSQATPDVLGWSQSLRPLRSRSPSPNRLSSEKVSTKDLPSSFMRRSDSAKDLRKSTGNMAANLTLTHANGKLTKSGELSNIEAEYIKNLQQQIYFLELEANYLREQAKKVTDMHPQMATEAERMLAKLRQMQKDIDGRDMEIKRHQSSLTISTTEKERILEKLRAEENARARDKNMLMDELVQVKKANDLLERDTARKDHQLLETKSELDRAATAMKNAEVKISTLKSQHDQRVEQHKMTQLALDEKRSELLSTETQLKELEDKYYNTTVQLQDQAATDQREEIRSLSQKLKETEMGADQERYLRTKITEDSSHLVRENALLNQQVLELQKQLEREKGLRESNDHRRSQNISDFVTLKDRENAAKLELDQTKDQLKREQERCQYYLEKVTNQENASTSHESQLSKVRDRQSELESQNVFVESENNQLRKDKMLLVDHVADLQKKLDDCQREHLLARGDNQSMRKRLNDLEHLKTLERTVQSQKWEEFGQLAASMRSLSATMAERNAESIQFS